MRDHLREMIQRRAEDDPGYAIAASLLVVADHLEDISHKLQAAIDTATEIYTEKRGG